MEKKTLGLLALFVLLAGGLVLVSAPDLLTQQPVSDEDERQENPWSNIAPPITGLDDITMNTIDTSPETDVLTTVSEPTLEEDGEYRFDVAYEDGQFKEELDGTDTEATEIDAFTTNQTVQINEIVERTLPPEVEPGETYALPVTLEVPQSTEEDEALIETVEKEETEFYNISVVDQTTGEKVIEGVPVESGQAQEVAEFTSADLEHDLVITAELNQDIGDEGNMSEYTAYEAADVTIGAPDQATMHYDGESLGLGGETSYTVDFLVAER